jgi:hypothetical protein
MIVQNYSSSDLETSMGLDRAIVAWLVVAAPVVESVELKDQMVSLLFRLSVRLFQSSKLGSHPIRSMGHSTCASRTGQHRSQMVRRTARVYRFAPEEKHRLPMGYLSHSESAGCFMGHVGTTQ